MKLTRRQCLIAGTGTAAFGSWLWMREASSSQEDIKTMQALTDQMKTYAVGRFLIDAPVSVRDASGTFETEIASVEARPGPFKVLTTVANALDAQLQEREADLRRQPVTPNGSSRFLGSWRGGSTVRVVYYLTPGVEPEGKADGFVARDDGVFFFQTNANEPADATELLDFLVDIEQKLTILNIEAIPKGPGFCIGTGLIATNPKSGENVTGWAWTLPDHPDVTFGLSTSTNDDKVRPGKLDRESSILREAGAALLMHVKTLRKRRFDLAGMAAQEWLVETTDEEPQYSFDLEIPGKPNDNARPFIMLRMQVGGSGKDGYAKPSLTTGEALALWDVLIHTLRLRPGAM